MLRISSGMLLLRALFIGTGKDGEDGPGGAWSDLGGAWSDLRGAWSDLGGAWLTMAGGCSSQRGPSVIELS